VTPASPLDGFSHTSDIEVRFRDTDAMGHVNNAVYLTYLEVARQAYWVRVAGTAPYDAVPFVVGRAVLDFRSPARVGETLRVALRTDWVGRSSFGLTYLVQERDSGRAVVEASTVLVTYDYTAHRSMPVPAWLRDGLTRVEGRALPDRPRTA
jgi:acyl-CoA thioester hydrolase